MWRARTSHAHLCLRASAPQPRAALVLRRPRGRLPLPRRLVCHLQCRAGEGRRRVERAQRGLSGPQDPVPPLLPGLHGPERRRHARDAAARLGRRRGRRPPCAGAQAAGARIRPRHFALRALGLRPGAGHADLIARGCFPGRGGHRVHRLGLQGQRHLALGLGQLQPPCQGDHPHPIRARVGRGARLSAADRTPLGCGRDGRLGAFGRGRAGARCARGVPGAHGQWLPFHGLDVGAGGRVALG